MKVKEMSIDELKALIYQAVEEKLYEILGDPDQGMELKEEVKDMLRKSLVATQHGERGIPAQEVALKMGLEW